MGGKISGGERIILSFKGKEFPPYLGRWIREGRCGGLIFFRGNFDTLSQFQDLMKAIMGSSPKHPLLLMVDQEGGRVERIERAVTHLPSHRDLARQEERAPGTIKALAAGLGRELRKVGISINLAPVMDVLTEPGNRVIGDRSFGSNSVEVASHAISFGRGLIEEGICPVMKHFPGHGMTVEDSHETLPQVHLSREELWKVHLKPFREGISEGFPALMTSHVKYLLIDRERPASLSVPIVKEIARGTLNFKGIVMSDDLNMKAISSSFTPAECVRYSTEATTDLLIHCGGEEEQGALLEAMSSLYGSKELLGEEKEKTRERIKIFSRYITSLPSP